MKYLMMAMLAMNAWSANAAKLYFSSQIDERSANFSVRVGDQECEIRSNQFTNVIISAPWIEQGITEKVARCEFDLAPGTYDYEIKVTTAAKRTGGYVYYTAFDRYPIDNHLVMFALENETRPNRRLKLMSLESYQRIKKNKPFESKGTITIL